MLTTKFIGDKIAELRKKKSLSQSQLAQHLFISSQAVGKWERGESMPDIITFNRLAEILGTDLNYFSENFHSIVTEKNLEKTRDNQESIGNQKTSWDMSRGNWMNADFSGLKNLHEKFNASNMQYCKFVGSDMSKLLLKSNNIESCDFSCSDISYSKVLSSNLANNLFKDCSLKETEFSESFIQGCDFSGADFSGVLFKSGGFQKNTITDAVWNRTAFNMMYIADMVFNGSVEDCSFVDCSFKKVTFQNATLINTFFKNKRLKGIQFIDCKADRMTYEFLKNGKADLTGVTLITHN